MADTPSSDPRLADARLKGLPSDKRRLLELMLRKQQQQAPDKLAAAEVTADGGGPRAVAGRGAAAPASFAQERLWLLEQLQPGSAYHIPLALRLRGPLDVAALARAVRTVGARHESLRTRFEARAGVPWQVIEPAGSQQSLEMQALDMPRRDLSGLPPEAREAEARRCLDAALLRPFDLTQSPLARALLLVLGPREHALVVVLHHVISDGWSLAVFQRELGAAYLGHQLPPLPLQYADYSLWQRSRLEDGPDGLASQIEWWRQRLAGLPPRLDLSVAKPPPARPTYTGGRRRLVFTEATTAALEALARRTGCTLFTVLLAGFQALLQRTSGSGPDEGADLAVGMPVAGRDWPRLEGLIGFFVNTLVLRGDLSGDPSFETLVARLHGVVLDAQEHADVPFDRLVAELAPERRRGQSPLFQVMFSFFEGAGAGSAAGDAVPALPGLDVERLQGSDLEAKFDLTLELGRAPSGAGGRAPSSGGALRGGLEYRADLFDATTAERLCRHLKVLLHAAALEPATPLSRLPLLTAGERQQLCFEWALPAADPLSSTLPSTLHGRALAWVARRPDAIAVHYGRHHLSYRQLDQRSQALAAWLATAGVDRGSVVAVPFTPCVELIVAYLGILRRGAAYLPLDPALPAERLAFQRADAGAAIELTVQDVASVPAVELARGEGRHIGLRLHSEPDSASDGIDLAYVLYTSGSTGKPKGVDVPHRGPLRMFDDPNAGFLNALDFLSALPSARDAVPGTPLRVSQAVNPAFDVSVYEIWGALVHGGCVVGLPRHVLADPPRLERHLAERRPHVTFLPAAVFAQAGPRRPRAFAGLQTLAAGGEAVDPEAARRVLASGAPPAWLLNGYGPTEASVFATFHTIRQVAADAASVPIGRPPSGTDAAVLDPAGQVLPLAAVGELCLGGRALAWGYRGRPSLTATAFVPHPLAGLSVKAGARTYRTGDLARWLSDGTLDCLGRRDHQVKIRGYRIELGEIEARLVALDGIAEAAVVVREMAGDRRLVAYVVGEGQEAEPPAAAQGTHTGGALPRSESETLGRGGPMWPPCGEAASGSGFARGTHLTLAAHLPDYMIPSAVVPVDALPLTPNGKLDRKRLASDPAYAPAAQTRAAGDGETPAAPRDELEAQLAALWGKLLAVETVGVDDDFFRLGGHSLLGTRLLAEIDAALGRRLSLAELFDAPTVAGQARILRQRAGGIGTEGDALPAPPPLEALARVGPGPWRFPLSFAQQRLWFLHRLQPGLVAYNMPLPLRLSGALLPAVLAAALAALVERHEVLRTTYSYGDVLADADVPPQQLVAVPSSRPLSVPLPAVDLRRVTGVRTAQALLQREARRPFDLANEPPLRGLLLHLPSEEASTAGDRNEYALLLTLHHIAGDGWSLGVLLRELVHLYAAIAERRQPNLPELPVQVADHASWQRDWLATSAGPDGRTVLDLQLDHWRHRLTGAPSLDLPLDRPRPAVFDDTGASCRHRLSDADATALRTLARTHGTTLFVTLLTGVQALLARWARQADVSVGVPVAGRRHKEVENLIGFFVNTLVVRGEMVSLTFQDLLTQLRRRVLDAYDHQDVPFERLVEELQGRRDRSRPPLFQVLFDLQPAALSGTRGAGELAERLPNLQLSTYSGDAAATGRVKFELELYASEGARGLELSVVYASALFDATTAARLLRQLGELLRSAADAPSTPLTELPLLGRAEAHQLLREVNDTRSRADLSVSLPAVVAQVADRQPHAIAATYGRHHLSYAELCRRAGYLATQLPAYGVRRGTLVGLCLAPSCDWLVAMLGILQSGGAYLPLDRAYPAERLAFLLRDTGAPVVLVDAAGREALAGVAGEVCCELVEPFPIPAPIVPSDVGATQCGRPGWGNPDPDAAAPQGGHRGADRIGPPLHRNGSGPEIGAPPITGDDMSPASPITGDDLAYVIYTSGSTGTPKGVAVPQRAVLRLVRDVRYVDLQLRGNRAVRTGQLANTAFDAATYEIWGALVHGGCVVGVPRAVTLGTGTPGADTTLRLGPWLRSRGVDTTFLTAALFAQEAGLDARAFAGLGDLLAGGEAVDPQAARRVLTSGAPPARLLNGYGPTECTTFAVVDTIAAPSTNASSVPNASVPIGRPIADTEALVIETGGGFGKALRGWAPVGVPGELCLGGAGLAWGYLRRPALTAAVFVPHADAGRADVDPGARLYRTGDLVRRLADGRLDYLGRLDRQVKLRGFRIELGEIEARLNEHPDVTEAAVVVREVEGDRRLVAYAVGAGSEPRSPAQGTHTGVPLPGSESELWVGAAPCGRPAAQPHPVSAHLRPYLADRLPDYMLPATFVALDALPLTVNGKIDRRRLANDPALAPNTRPVPAPATAPETAPRDELEAQLAALWARLLGVASVGVDEDFFELGGHSILATRVMVEVEGLVGFQVPLAELFTAPTVAGFAERVRALQAEAAGGTASRVALPPLEPRRRTGTGIGTGLDGNGPWPFPISFAQQRLWFIDRLDPGSAVYHIPLQLRLGGELQPARLASTLRALVGRHEILRTTYSSPVHDEKVPRQWVHAPTSRLGRVELPLVDLQGLPEVARDAERTRLAAIEARRPFDLEAGPVLRALLVRLADGGAAAQHALIFTVHHIAADGWSLGLLTREVAALYEGPTTLDELPVQYADYSTWQRDWLDSTDAEGRSVLDLQIDYWRTQLHALAPLDLPLDRPRPSIFDHRAAGRWRHEFPAALVARLRRSSQQAGCTLYVTLLTAFQVLLGRWAGQSGGQADVTVGTPVTGRRHRHLEPLIGLFVNTLVLRGDLSATADRLEGRLLEGPAFDALRRRAQQTVLDAYEHQDLPFERLVELLQPARDRSRAPLFQVLFALQELDLGRGFELPGLHLRSEGIDAGTQRLDLEVQLFEAEDAAGRPILRLDAGFSSALFDATTIGRLLTAFECLLDAAVEAPSTPIHRLPLLGVAQRHQLLAEWNDTEEPFLSGRTVPELVVARAAERPDAIVFHTSSFHPALYRDEERDEERGEEATSQRPHGQRPSSSAASRATGVVSRLLSYGELDRRSARLARHLVALGVRREQAVGIYLDAGPELLVAMVGVLRAGGAYLPLDPVYPSERLAYMLEHSRAEVLLTRRGLRASVPPFSGRVLDLQTVIETKTVQNSTNAAQRAQLARPALDPEQLLCLLYTSGSTGRPKGVGMVQRAALRTVSGQDYLRFSAAVRMPLLNNLSFDPTIAEFWGPTTHGGCLLAMDRGLLLEPVELGTELRRLGANIACLPTTAVHQIGRQTPGALGCLDQVLFGGEAAERDPLLGYYSMDASKAAGTWGRPPGWIVNGYGPTESTLLVTREPLGGRTLRASQLYIPIGRPLRNSQVLVFERGGAVAPMGVPGELRLGGQGLNRGYVRQPSRTAAAFVPHPFAGRAGLAAGVRLYRSGDLARMLADGRVEFLGRIDNQIKLRGYRIELGEIEARLLEAEGVAAATVVVRRDGPAGDRLVAYVVGEGRPQPLPEALRAHLTAHLPAYMVPSAFVLLEDLPKNTHDKVDRRALREDPVYAPEAHAAGGSEDAAGASSRVPPRDALEARVATHWQRVLGVERLGVEDDFFQLGGHSLLAMQLAAAVQEDFGTGLPLAELFAAPTVAGVAAFLRLQGFEGSAVEGAGTQAAAIRGTAALVALPRDGRPPWEFPMSFGQQRLWFLDRLEPGQAAYNMPSALRLHGRLRPASLASALGSVLERHEMLRTTLAQVAGEAVQRVWPAAAVRRSWGTLPCVDLSLLAPTDREAEVRRLGSLEARRPFDLERGPLLRSLLLRLDPPSQEPAREQTQNQTGAEIQTGDHIFLLVLHHIAGDGWSMGILVQEISATYRTAVNVETSKLPELPVQYADYATWQRQWLEEQLEERSGERLQEGLQDWAAAGTRLDAQLAWWRQQLQGAETLDLPLDRPRPPVFDPRAGQRVGRLGAELTARLRQRARDAGHTLFVSLLAGYQVLLARLAGQSLPRLDVSVGTPVAGRRHPRVEGLIGFFVNTLVLRGNLPSAPGAASASSDGPSFAELEAHLARVLVGAQDHQDIPFERLVEELQPSRDRSRAPLFQVFLSLQSLPMAANPQQAGPRQGLELPGLRLESVSPELQECKFDLEVGFTEATLGREANAEGTGARHDVLEITGLFAAALFDATSVERLLRQLETLLDAATAAPHLPLAQLDLLTAGQRQQLLCEWQGPAGASTGEELFDSVPLQVLRRAAERPRAPAVVAGDGVLGEVLSYGELASGACSLARTLARALARQLQFPGGSEGAAGVDELVAVDLPRSASEAIALTGVLLAGAAYLPLDPAAPDERLAFVLRDAGARVVLTDRPERFAVEVFAGLDLLVLSVESLEEVPGDSWDLCIPPLARAYVIYTSGSTGVPKGVELTHGGLANLTDWYRRSHGVTAGTRVPRIASPAFDASVLDLWPALTAGAELHLPAAEELSSPPRLRDWLCQHRIEVAHLPTALAAPLLELEWPETCLRRLLTGGDRLGRRPSASLPFALLNNYGPTETTVLASSGWVSVDLAGALAGALTGAPDLGRPLPGVEILLLDAALRPVPLGARGRIFVAGAGLARGYLRRPARTAGSFVPHPLSGRLGHVPPGARLYDTGDLGHLDAAGRLHFDGRADHQLKVRGFRVEAGEIENALREHPAVVDAAVVLRGTVQRGMALVAYVEVVGLDREVTLDLSSHLGSRLPDYMRPQHLVVLDALPRTAGTKADRRALAYDERYRVEVQGGEAVRTAPRDETEVRLAALWARRLELDEVGVDDDFFTLGGHSVLAMQVLGDVEEAFGVQVTLADLFAAPTVAGLAERLQGAATGAPPLESLPRVGVPPYEFPASYAQQRLWFLEHMNPALVAYNMPMHHRLDGDLDVPRLGRALSALVRRQEVLRTRYQARGRQVMQLVDAAAPQPLPLIDLGGLPASARPTLAAQLQQREAFRPFELDRQGPLRTLLLRLTPTMEDSATPSSTPSSMGSEQRHLLLLTLHHIAGDGWSVGVMLRELSSLYAGTSSLPPVEVQYADFAAWQRGWLDAAADDGGDGSAAGGATVLDRQIDWWRSRLDDLATLDLPTDRPRPPVFDEAAGHHHHALPPALGRQLRERSRDAGCTLFVTLLAAVQALFGRLAGSVDVPIGSSIAGRRRRQLENAIGFFVNTLVLRGDLRADDAPAADNGATTGTSTGPSFETLQRRAQDTVTGAYDHQDVPFERLVEELRPVRDRSRTPLFQVLFVLQNVPRGQQADLALPGVELGLAPVQAVAAKFDLELYASEAPAADGAASDGDASDGDDIHLECVYRSSLFDATTIRRLLGRLEVLLSAAAAEPSRPLAELPLLDAGERQQLLVEWLQAPAATTGPADTLPGRALAAARHAPDALAAAFGRRCLSYGELERRSARLAAALVAAGIRRGDIVGVVLPRVPELLIAWLAVTRASAAYQPLDPGLPPERLSFLLRDAAACAVIALPDFTLPISAPDLPRLAPIVPSDVGATQCGRPGWGNPDPDAAAPQGSHRYAGRIGLPLHQNGSDPDIGASPITASDLAYVLYTSGSTGQPKGVAIPHRGLLRFVDAPFPGPPLDLPAASPGARISQAVNTAFDVAEWEVWTALTRGGCLVALRTDILLDPRRLRRHFLERRPDVTFLPAAAFAQDARRRPDAFAGAGDLILGGEAVDPEATRQVLASSAPPRRLINGYGPSEVSVYSVMAHVRQLDAAATSVPIGRPPTGTDALVLDRWGRPAGVGVIGELGLGGAGQAWGYHKRPALTAQSFVPHPLAGCNGIPGGARLYRTGDLARWRPDGNLDCLGRIDHQVQIRGFRVELGEIEARLNEHPRVVESAVVVRSDAGSRLIAYLQPEFAEEILDDDLSDWLGAFLPEYMVPSDFIQLEALPQSANGKIDRRRLRDDPELAPEVGVIAAEPPRDELETELVELWATMLSVPAVGIHDDFFQLGGHSMSAAWIATEVAERYGVEVPVAELFEEPTVARLAESLRRRMAQASDESSD